MNLHEFQAKEILARRGVPVPTGQVAWTPEEAARIAREIAVARFAVKAQILAGGRGEAAGVRLAPTSDAVRGIAAEMLGAKLVTAQTGPLGRIVRRVYVEEAVAFERDIYLAVLVDRLKGQLLLIGARQGGEDIEERIARRPESLERLPLRSGTIPAADELEAFAERLGLDGPHREQAAALCRALVESFFELDASLIEINPLAVARDRGLVALDVKMTIDDNALFRHPDLQALRDEDESDPVELEAQRHDLNFVRMDGDIGVVVNGAGLALATHDMLVDAGGRPANFMDIRTTAMSLQIAKGIGLLLADPRVKAILVNIHGGGMTRCDTIVEAIHVARRWSGRSVPMVVRLAGQNADYARGMLADRQIPHEIAADMAEAARRAVALARGARA
ncbi:MAG TPA: ADP-forming succinate--CoA ligase subunit beta [Afifellaceae bacterium]|nr:ADP-forming succinate--CoA ligase subunit beta [Afifellaceae bacterium]